MNWFKRLFSISLDDVFNEEDAKAITTGELGSAALLLETYSLEDAYSNFEHFGVLPYLKSIGYEHPRVTFETSDPFVHKVRITDPKVQNNPSESNFLIYIFFRRKNFTLIDFSKSVARYHSLLDSSESKSLEHESHNYKDSPPSPHTITNDPKDERVLKFMRKNLSKELKMTVIEWTCMQNPLKEFDKSFRPQLPGQKHPGLGCGRKVGDLLLHLAREHHRDGLLNTPEYFHNAIFYEIQGFRFINPSYEGYFRSIMHDLESDIKEYGLPAVSWAFYTGHLIDKTTGISEKWIPQEQVYPTSDTMKNYFDHHEYHQLVQEFETKNRFYINWEEAEVAKQFIVHKK